MVYRKCVNGAYFDMTEEEIAEIMDANAPRNIGYTAAELSSMTNAELEQILYRYGRTANMNKSNMIDWILHLQADKNSL